MYIKFLGVISLLFFASSIALGADENNVDQNIDNISSEYAECASYFTIVYHAMVSSNKTDTEAKYGELQESAIQAAVLLATQGRNQERAVEVVTERMKLYNENMKKEANYSNQNIGVLIDKYHNKCIDVITKPETILNKAE